MREQSLFDFPHYSISKPIRLIELFGGIGSQAMALRDIGANFEHYRLVEFDKYSVASYNAIHGTHFVPQDITKINGEDLGIGDIENYTYLMTYSFPCQDLSLAGKQRGMSKGSGTRSGLLWEVERLLNEVENLPQVLLMENVPQVHAEKNKADFDSWLAYLRKRGYQNFWQDLNAKDYGIPQNRDRCFCISILADDFIDFEFPNTIKLASVMKDYLESDVDEKYYINNEKAQKLIEKLLENGVLKKAKTVHTNGLDNIEPAKTEQELLPCLMNYRRVDTVNNAVAKTLMARDSKGFGTGFETQNAVIREVHTIDLCVKNPKEITVANCIKARYDCGVRTRQADGSGVVESTQG